jgi:hypothetical protein
MVVTMAAGAFGQDPNRNRMNEPYPEVQRQECNGCPSAVFPFANGNRMNVLYAETTSAELTGGPNPFGNRMNVEWPKAQPKAQPKQAEKEPINPYPRP